jgi:DNA-binding MarR family transcriptional regulator
VVDTRWLDEEEMRAWRVFLRSHADLLVRLDRELEAEHGLSLAEYEVLAFLSEAPGERLRMSELARRVLVSPSALTRRMDRLEKQGLVRRERCTDDARGAYAVLSGQGRVRIETAAPTHVRGVRAHFIDRLSRTQLSALAEALEVVPAVESVRSLSST